MASESSIPLSPQRFHDRGVPRSLGVPLVKANVFPWIVSAGQSSPERRTSSGLWS